MKGMASVGGIVMVSENSKQIITTLNNAGYEAYLVGGCVRDTVIGIPISDWDITTNATPEQVREVFHENKIIETGIKHGTVTLLIKGESFEITTFRTDSVYLDHRHPEEVKYSDSLDEDLMRRDFTMNALAYHPEKGMIDLFDGIKDIEQKVIRCVGNPNQRFEEDSLRILRGIRFASKLGFRIEENTKQAMYDNKHLLLFLSRERITKELLETIKGEYAFDVLMEYKGVLKGVINCIDELVIDKKILNSLKKDSILRFSSFVLPLSKETLSELLKSLRLSRKEEERIKTIYYYQKVMFTDDTKQLKHLMSKVSCEIFNDLVDLFANEKENIRKLYTTIIKTNQCYKLSMLEISGTDLQTMDIAPNEIGNILNLLLNKVIDEEIGNSKDELLEYVRLIT